MHLVNGPYPNQGRLEVVYNGAWGTVCDWGWDIFDAQVICRQLGFPSVVVALDGTDTEELYGYGDGEIFLYELECEGPEANLAQCLYSVPRYSACVHSNDVGVVCYSDDYPSVDPRQTDEKYPNGTCKTKFSVICTVDSHFFQLGHQYSIFAYNV